MQAFLATLFTWGVTMLGASIVFFFREVKKGIMDALLGFSAGVMIAASFWSLLSPAIDMANSMKMISWLVVFLGFFSGGLLLFLGDKLYDFMQKKMRKRESTTSHRLKRCLMLVFSITLHNIPEGLNVGLAFGVALASKDMSSPLFLSALMLSVGMAIQNFPEGAAVSIPLLEEGYSKNKAFWFGTLTGLVEPIAAAIGILLSFQVTQFMPWGLSFAAGCMVYVVIEDLFPELFEYKNRHFGIWAFIVGFVLMMILDSISSI